MLSFKKKDKIITKLYLGCGNKENKITQMHNNNVPALLDLGTSPQAPSESEPTTISGVQGTENSCDLSDVIFQC